MDDAADLLEPAQPVSISWDGVQLKSPPMHQGPFRLAKVHAIVSSRSRFGFARAPMEW